MLPPLSPCQPVIADGEIIFSGSIPRQFFSFALFFLFCFRTSFCCAHHEGTAQAPIATVSLYRKHSRTACNRPYTEQQSTYSSTLVSTECDNASKHTRASQVLPRATMYEYFTFSFFLFVAVLWIMRLQSQQLILFFSMYRWHSALWWAAV